MPKTMQEVEIEKKHLDLYLRSLKHLQELPRFSWDSTEQEYQNIGVGSVFPALPGATDVFVVAQCEPEHSLVLAWRWPSGKYQTTWAFVLEQPQPGQTRLIVRGRVAPGYRPYSLPQWLAIPTGALAHFIMQRKQLLENARRAETYDRR